MMFTEQLPTLRTEEVTQEEIVPTIDSPNMQEEIMGAGKQKVKRKIFTPVKTAIGVFLVFSMILGFYLLYSHVFVL